MKEPKDLLQTSYCQAPEDAPRGPTTMCERARKQNKTHYNVLCWYVCTKYPSFVYLVTYVKKFTHLE